MNDREFNALSDTALAKIEEILETCGDDVDFSTVSDGVLEIERADGSKVIVNRHAALREMWLAARSGGYHFAWNGSAWIAHDGRELFAVLRELLAAGS